MPSSSRQIATTAERFCAVSSKAGLCSRARSANRAIPGNRRATSGSRSSPGGTGSGDNWYRHSPETRSTSRLVAMMRRWLALRSSASASAAHASATCSQLSRTSSVRRLARNSAMDAATGVPGCARSASTCATDCATSCPSDSPASSTSHTPSGYSSRMSAASCSASRVLPMPPGPASVKSRCWPRSLRNSAMAPCLPTKELGCWGRLFGVESSERSGGKSASRSGWTSW